MKLHPVGKPNSKPEDLSSPQRHTFRVPPEPKAGFDGIVARCQVLECEPPSRLAYSWSAGPIIDTQVSYRPLPDGDPLAGKYSFDLFQGSPGK